MADYRKVAPRPNALDREFWEGCRRHELLIQRCKACGTYRWLPRPMCDVCNSMDVEWARSSGNGRVYTYTIVSSRTGSLFDEDIPYAVVFVELEEGVRTIGSITNCKPEDVRVDMPVRVVFDDLTEDCTLPRFRAL